MKALILILMMGCAAAQADTRALSPMPSANVGKQDGIAFDYDVKHYVPSIWYSGKRDFDRDPIPKFRYCGTAYIKEKNQESPVVYPKNLWDRLKFWPW